MWRGGCIIRSRFLGKIKEAFDKDPGLVNLMLDRYFGDELAKCQAGWRRVVAAAAMNGVPVPAFSTALACLTAGSWCWLISIPLAAETSFRCAMGADPLTAHGRRSPRFVS
jgi:hypothetical protein